MLDKTFETNRDRFVCSDHTLHSISPPRKEVHYRPLSPATAKEVKRNRLDTVDQVMYAQHRLKYSKVWIQKGEPSPPYDVTK